MKKCIRCLTFDTPDFLCPICEAELNKKEHDREMMAEYREEALRDLADYRQELNEQFNQDKY